MKQAFVSILIAAFLFGCSSNTEQAQNNSSSATDSTLAEKPAASKISGAVADSLLAQLCRKWYSKKIVMSNGTDNMEYPTNNEELTLVNDMSYTAVDHAANDSLAGSWQIVTERIIQLTDQSGESHRFELTQLTSDSLITRVLEGGEDEVSIHYGATE